MSTLKSALRLLNRLYDIRSEFCLSFGHHLDIWNEVARFVSTRCQLILITTHWRQKVCWLRPLTTLVKMSRMLAHQYREVLPHLKLGSIQVHQPVLIGPLDSADWRGRVRSSLTSSHLSLTDALDVVWEMSHAMVSLLNVSWSELWFELVCSAHKVWVFPHVSLGCHQTLFILHFCRHHDVLIIWDVNLHLLLTFILSRCKALGIFVSVKRHWVEHQFGFKSFLVHSIWLDDLIMVCWGHYYDWRSLPFCICTFLSVQIFCGWWSWMVWFYLISISSCMISNNIEAFFFDIKWVGNL